MSGRPDQDLLILHRDHDVVGLSRTRQPRDPVLDDLNGPEKALASDVTDDLGMFDLVKKKHNLSFISSGKAPWSSERLALETDFQGSNPSHGEVVICYLYSSTS